MLLALQQEIARAGGASLDLTVLARRLEVDREVARSMLLDAIARGWLPEVEFSALPGGCGTSDCHPDPAGPACRRCPLAR